MRGRVGGSRSGPYDCDRCARLRVHGSNAASEAPQHLDGKGDVERQAQSSQQGPEATRDDPFLLEHPKVQLSWDGATATHGIGSGIGSPLSMAMMRAMAIQAGSDGDDNNPGNDDGDGNDGGNKQDQQVVIENSLGYFLPVAVYEHYLQEDDKARPPDPVDLKFLNFGGRWMRGVVMPDNVNGQAPPLGAIKLSSRVQVGRSTSVLQ